MQKVNSDCIFHKQRKSPSICSFNWFRNKRSKGWQLNYSCVGKIAMNKSRLICIVFLLGLVGCQQPIPTAITPVSKCSDKPVNSLEAKNVKPISVNTQEVKESGIVRPESSIGFSFDAKSGQQFSYRTDDSICIWVYTPDNQLLTNGKLPLDGKYIVQVSAPKGQAAFNLAMKISNNEIVQSSVAEKTIPEPSLQVTKSSPSPEQALIDYYAGVNNRNYETTWKLLSPQFKSKKSISYSDYQNWWRTVRTVKITKTSLNSRSGDRAYIDGDLQYITNDGVVHNDSNRYFLVWKPDLSHWVIEDTTRL